MTKKGFTLMELLVSIFITGMVMLSLVAMWRSSSNQTSQAQRQSIIRNESTIFLRRLYSDFVSASVSIRPWFYTIETTPTVSSDTYIAVKEAVIDADTIGTNSLGLIRVTGPVCGSGNNSWATNEDIDAISRRCIKPSYVVYKVVEVADEMQNGRQDIYRCSNTFLDSNSNTITISNFMSQVNTYCDYENQRERFENVMPYVTNFTLSKEGDYGLRINYTVNRAFEADIPPVNFKFNHLLTVKRGA